ncbi:MAG: hypothetical protein HY901_14590 [Deltaproteobacteria bacterium]|nr:hypothetical protein [Deltaproteobacteria bacterium]
MAATTSEGRYPEAKTVQVEVERPEHGPYGKTETLRFDRDHPEWVHCTNPACNSGKILLRRTVTKAIEGKKAEFSAEVKCNGVEKARAGLGHPCMTRAKITVRATYRT